MEKLYQYIWKYRLLPKELATTDGRAVKVISTGLHNSDSGPDFSGARLIIGGDDMAGNVEVHVKASDWFAHNHHTDPAYSNVILHFVAISDKYIPDGCGGLIPQVAYQIPESFQRLYGRLADNIRCVKCEAELWRLPPLTLTSWIDSLAVERIQQKAGRILDEVKQSNGDWQRACFITFARSLGFSLNSLPMEMLARSIPLQVLAKHSDNLFQLEALIFGQAGMLDVSKFILDQYYQNLCREYYFLSRKYGLRPLRQDIWKYNRTRPMNFPTRRLALLALALKGGFGMMARILDYDGTQDSVDSLFDFKMEGYWASHFDFGKPILTTGLSALSSSNLQLLLINFVAPMLYAYGAAHCDPDLAERGLDIWRDTEAENNTYIRQWRNAGISCVSAVDSQALLQLRKEYCDNGHCLKCRFGHALLREMSDASDRLLREPRENMLREPQEEGCINQEN